MEHMTYKSQFQLCSSCVKTLEYCSILFHATRTISCRFDIDLLQYFIYVLWLNNIRRFNPSL